KEAAESHAAGAARLDEGKGGHFRVGRLALYDGDLARAVEHHGWHLPGFDELGEVPRLPRFPDATRPVGILLDEPMDGPGLRHAVDEVGGLAVGRGPAA